MKKRPEIVRGQAINPGTEASENGSHPGHRFALLLGSNIEPEKNMPMALALLQKQLAILKVSSIWESRAVGMDGANFLNAALLAYSALEAEDLKAQVLRPLEAQLGRIRSNDKYAPRTIDLDILLFDGDLLEPGLWANAFRAVPLAEILPDYRSTEGETLQKVALRLSYTTPIWIRKDVSLDPLPSAGI